MSLKKFVIYLFALFLLASCGNNNSKSISKLDRQKGFNGLVLGDSTYNNFIQKVKNESNDDEIIERKIFGNVIVPAQKIENLDHRFIYGILMPNFFVAALNGKIYSYTLTNTNSDSTSQRKLLDSLKTNYGEPDISKDTSYVIDSYPIKNHIKIWKGNKVELSYVWNKNFIKLKIVDIPSEKVIEKIRNHIDSTSKNAPKRLVKLHRIGRLNLFSTKQELLKKRMLIIEKIPLNDTTLTTYEINYNKYLKTYFGIKNREYINSLGLKENVINTDLKFNKTDSLDSISISFKKDDNDIYINPSQEVSYSNLLNILGKRFGKYSFVEILKTKKKKFRRSFWLSKNLTIELQDVPSLNEVDVNFYKKFNLFSFYRLEYGRSWF